MPLPPGAIFPSRHDPAAWAKTIEIAVTYGVLKAAPADGAYRNDLAKKALDALPAGTDVNGASFKPATITLTEGGK